MTHENLIETIQQIDWKNLHHAYGEASDVPDQIIALTSPDAEVRKKAYWELYGNIFHQGTRYEATAYAIPFLFNLLDNHNTPERSSLIDLLVSCALGYEAIYLPLGLGQDAMNAQPWDVDEQNYWVDEVYAYRAVEMGVPSLIACLRDDDKAVQHCAAYALAWFPRYATESADALHIYLAQAEQSPNDVANALLALSLLGRHLQSAETVFALLQSHFADHNDRLVRLASAIGTVTLQQESADDTMVAFLLEQLQGDVSDLPKLRWNEGDWHGYITAVVALLGERRLEQIAEAAFAALRQASGEIAFSITDTLLQLLFRQPINDARELTTLQRQMLEITATHKPIWMLGSGLFANYALLMQNYGLPSDQKAMRAFLAQ